MAATPHSTTYSPPTIPTKIKDLDRIYMIPMTNSNRFCLVFTSEKTKQAVEAVFMKGEERPYAFIPMEEIRDKEVYLAYDFQYSRYSQISSKLIDLLGKIEKAQVEKVDQAKRIPVLLVLVGLEI